jgi:hypothetical protein
MGVHTLFIRCAIYVGIILNLFLFSGCAVLQSSQVSPNFDKNKFKRVGLLVCRVGSFNSGVIAPIVLETDYSNRIPKRELSAGMLYLKEHKDVYIETDSRIKESFPDYPRIRNAFMGETFFKNITPDIYRVVESCLSTKGYLVTDVAGTSRAWNKPLSEMTVLEIISRLRGYVDALFVLHYMDIAVDGEFSEIMYNFSIFDLSTNERVLYFNSRWPYPSIIEAIHKDPSVPPGTITKEKVSDSSSEVLQYGGKARITTTTYSYKHNMSSDEITRYALKYMRYGFPAGSGSESRPGLTAGSLPPSLESLIP